MSENNIRITTGASTNRLWLALTLRIVLPSMLGVLLLAVVIFWLVLPHMESDLMDSKREVIRSLTQAICTKLKAYDQQVRAGQLTLQQAQEQALAVVRDMRYGDQEKDYFWIMDSRTHMIMHPYRIDLIGRDLSSEVDPAGQHIYRQFVETAQRRGGGYVNYTFQWKDDRRRIAPKLSYVQYFAPWGWVIGTGIYTDDVNAQIQSVSNHLGWAVGIVLVVVACLSGFVALSSCRSEHRRRKAEAEVIRLNASLEQRIEQRTLDLAGMNHQLQVEVEDRKYAQHSLAATLDHQLDINALQHMLLATDALSTKLARITDTAVRLFDLDSCRIWVTKPGDACTVGCAYANSEEQLFKCPGKCLHLLAGSGRTSDTDDCDQTRIPLGIHRLGELAAGTQRKLLSNNIANDSRVQNREWAKELGLVAFATYQLRPPVGETIGMMVVFSRHTITPEVDAVLENLVNTATRVIINARLDEEQDRLNERLAQSQRLESVGQLAAGIAHEINTPTQFVSDNIRFLRGAFPKLLELLTLHQQVVDDYRSGKTIERSLAQLADAVRKAKLEYLLEQIPGALSDSLEGLDRVTTIVRAMKDFSHPGQNEMALADLNKAIESTVTVARNEWKYVAEMKLDLEPGLNPVPCLIGDINQVILNLVVNAAHAIKHVAQNEQTKGTITVSTRQDGRWAEIRVKDTGTGIAPEHCERVFDHFFTTKPVGEGTGQGLSFARRVIVEQHGGSLTFETEVGKGTTFVIRLPMAENGDVDMTLARQHETLTVG